LADPLDYLKNKRPDRDSGVDYDGEIRFTLHMIVSPLDAK